MHPLPSKYRNRPYAPRLAARLLAGFALLGALRAEAQTFEIQRFTIAAGGGRSEAGPFTLFGVTGQCEGDESLTGGPFSLRGGFAPRRRAYGAQWLCPSTSPGSWSTTSCWSGLRSADSYPNNGAATYAVTLPTGNYQVLVNPADVTIDFAYLVGSDDPLIATKLYAYGHMLTIVGAPGGRGTIGALGSGSTLSLPNLRQIAGPTHGTLTLEAKANGHIELPILTSVTGNVSFYAHQDNRNAIVHCPRLGHVSSGTQITVESGGKFIGAPLVDVSGATITVRGSGSELDLSHMTRMDDTRVLADGAARVSMPGITTYSAGGLDCGTHSLLAKNSDSQLVFPALTAIRSGACQSVTLGVYKTSPPSTDPAATRSGHLSLPVLASMTGRVNISADGPDGLIELGMADLAANATLGVVNGAELKILGSMRYAMTSATWNTGTLRMTGGTPGNCVTLEVASRDCGPNPSGCTPDSRLQRLVIGPGAHVRLVDELNNGHRGGSGGTAEAFYTDTLEFADSSATLDVSGLHLYYGSLVGSAGQIRNGNGCRAVGDLNCDGSVSAADVPQMVLALVDPSQFAGCDITQADMNGDGSADGDDIGPFVAALIRP